MLKSLLPIAVTAFLGTALGLMVGAGHRSGADSAAQAEPTVVDSHLREAGRDGPTSTEGSNGRDLAGDLVALSQRQQVLVESVTAMRAEIAALRSALATNAHPGPTPMRSNAELEALILDVVEHARELQAEARARAVEEEIAEAQALRQGPYGSYNYRVNRVSQALALTADQERAYYDLLTTYTDAADAVSAELQQELAWSGEGGAAVQHRIHALLTRTAELEAALQQEFAQVLDAEQRAQLETLGPEVRQLGGPMVVADSDFSEPPR
jgi:hypothetical protein